MILTRVLTVLDHQTVSVPGPLFGNFGVSSVAMDAWFEAAFEHNPPLHWRDVRPSMYALAATRLGL